ncbi:MAG: murein biosynthesis integral membrane protein MurJ [Candidatus Goldiibacteriota bacterium]
MSSRKIAFSAGIVSAITMLSRVLGYIRDAFSAALFGVGIVSDAFFVAFRIPNLLRNLLAEGALSSAFIPVFTDYIENRKQKDVWNLAANVLTLLALILVFAAALGIFAAPWIVKIIAPGFVDDKEKFILTVKLTRIMFPFIIFVSVSALFMGVLNSFKKFSIPAFAPVVLNVFMIAAGAFLCPALGVSPEKQIYGWAAGALAGAFFQVIMQYIPVVKLGFGLKAVINLKDAGLKRIGRLMVPATLAQSVTQLNLLVNTILASLLAEGAVTYLYYGNRIMQLPFGVFGVAIATVAFPYIAGYAARKESKKMRDTIHTSLKQTFFIVIPASAGIIFMSGYINALLFYYGRFTMEDTLNTAGVCIMYTIAVFAFSGIKILTQVFYTINKAKTAVKISAASLVLNIFFCIILMGPMQYMGLALAASIAGIIHFILLYIFVEKYTGDLRTGELAVFFIKTTAASVVMGGVIMFVSHAMSGAWNTDFSRTVNALIVFANIILGVVVYFALLPLFRISEGRTLALEFLKKLKKRKKNSSMP